MTNSNLNSVMMQYFHWHIKPEQILWTEVKNNVQDLKNAGITAVWLPPAYKGFNGLQDVGYAVYDLYDLGEFEQKGTIRTKYGPKEQYLDAIKALKDEGILIYADVVLNHLMGGDEIETAKATPFPENDRTYPQGGMREIKAYTHFNFPGRKGKYSTFEWHWWHFDGVDWDAITQEQNMIYLFEGKQFDDYVDLEKGNFDYLMGCDLDFQNEEVRKELIQWGKWYLKNTGVDGFRLDAIKHISTWFFPGWIDELEKESGKELFLVGEYWINKLDTLQWYVNQLNGKISLFDVPLHYNFYFASQANGNYDMAQILNGTMMQQDPTHAVTFVDNHDTQPLQAAQSPVEPWFKPLAYALILLRREGIPCIFYPDYYGAEYEGQKLPSHRFLIDKFLDARHNYNYGEQYDYFDHYDTIGWTRLGNQDHPQAMAVIMSDNTAGYKWMEVGKPHAKFYDLTEHIKEPIETNDNGWAEFRCQSRSVSVWIQE